jgi:hypothetical protein
LITTRIDSILPAAAQRQLVDAMNDQEALKLLSWELPPDQAATQNLELGKLVTRLGEWPLLLKLVNGFLRDRMKSGQPLTEALAGVNKRLDKKGLVLFDARNPLDRSNAVARTVGASLELLDNDRRTRFGELGIFPEDADVPLGILSCLWAETGRLDEFETEDLLAELYGLSLLLSLDLDRRTFRLHDVLRHFLQEQAGMEGLVAQHKRLLGAIADDVADPRVTDALSRRYFYLHLPDHLVAANERDRLNKLLLDPGWLKAKLAATGSPWSLVADYDRHAADEFQVLIGRTLRLSAGICARDQRQLIPQLLGRLTACEGTVAKHFLDMARRHLSPPAILTQQASLTPPGVETARLEGHSAWVTALCMLPDGRLASGANDNTIRLWDLKTGAETAPLRGSLGLGQRAVHPARRGARLGRL